VDFPSISIIGPARCTVCCQFITINSLYMFRALFAHHQEALYLHKLVCTDIPSAVYTVPPDNEQ
jgi:hypothetical protein